ncbi:MAG: M14 family zinc carboxypeptidase, partial [Gammaproteobacteria bacterium]|nr:M14 family zinc carboxypeptidase [Gammaproteobacteria bacterium]
EISSTDAAMMTAYHLLAAPEDAINRKILANSIVFIDPLQNPDGRARFTSRYYATVGIQHSSDRYSAEHNEPWPNGRTNHYLFDMNRDWLTLTQPESKARVKVMQQYFPLVVIDLHEMGGDSSYYFAPAADPFNPHLEKNQLDNMATIGKNNGKHFDSFGFDYFTREVFDAFYPGYGDSWPAFYGAVTSTYEVSSSRGEIFAKRTGEEMSYRDTVKRHFVASISTAESVADNREKLLKDFYRYQVTAINSGKSDRKERVFVIADKVNRSGAHRLATLMAEHGVVVNKALKPFTSCGKRFDAGSFFIDTAQPRGRFVKTSLTRQVDMDYDFLKEQERRRDRKLEDQIYDVTGWSLPLMFNVETHACAQTVNVKSERLSANVPLIGSIENPDARVAYIVSWGDVSAGRFLTSALKNGLVVKSADQAFTVNDKNYPAGSLIIERRRNDVSVKNIVSKIAKETGALVDGIDTSWVTKGPSFGSENTVTLIAPKVAMAWDEPTSVLNAGAARFVIERQFNYP